MKRTSSHTWLPLALGSILAAPLPYLEASSLSIGADTILRHVSVEERDASIKSQDYYDQQIQAYLTTDLSKDVEASIRVQSITPWGLEGSTNPLTTRYPNANGSLWVQNAYVRLPNIWKNRIALTFGRQPIQWGEGTILSDDDLGFNAIRAQIKSPFRIIDFDVDVFTAKVTEGLRTPGDTDVSGIQLGTQHELVRWEVMALFERSNSAQNYAMGSETIPVNASRLERNIYGLRARSNLKDAFIKGEVYIQNGNITRSPSSADIKLGGMGYNVGVGGKADVKFLGRFGTVLELQNGSGDDPSTAGEDEAIRPTYASRWSGLERKGMGRYFAAGLTDAYSPSNPFGQVSSVNTGLPAGTSGIQTIHFGLESTPWAAWTFLIDYFQYKAQEALGGSKDLGSEIDYGIEYRYSGLVTFKATIATFGPGEAFPEAGRQNGRQMTSEVQIKF